MLEGCFGNWFWLFMVDVWYNDHRFNTACSEETFLNYRVTGRLGLVGSNVMYGKILCYSNLA